MHLASKVLQRMIGIDRVHRTAILCSEQPSSHTCALCLCNPGLRHVVIPFSELIDKHWVHGREEEDGPVDFRILASMDMAELFAKRRWCKEEISVLCGSVFC